LEQLVKVSVEVRRHASSTACVRVRIFTPEEAGTSIPVLIAPGWAQTWKVFREPASQIAGAGRRVILIDHPRRCGGDRTDDSYPIVQTRKAEGILLALAREQVDRIDLVAVSEGAINATIAAARKPELVRNLILVGPAGLSGEDTYRTLSTRFAIKNLRTMLGFIDSRTSPAVASRWREGAKYILQNPYRVYQEGKAVATSSISDLLKELHDKGIGVAIMHGVDDAGFPMHKVQETLREATLHQGLARTFLDGFASVQGGHDDLYVFPERYAGAVERVLSALERRHRATQDP
jgi:pimeloyl-ACP methyl ester carboxylesterase